MNRSMMLYSLFLTALASTQANAWWLGRSNTMHTRTTRKMRLPSIKPVPLFATGLAAAACWYVWHNYLSANSAKPLPWVLRWLSPFVRKRAVPIPDQRPAVHLTDKIVLSNVTETAAVPRFSDAVIFAGNASLYRINTLEIPHSWTIAHMMRHIEFSPENKQNNRRIFIQTIKRDAETHYENAIIDIPAGQTAIAYWTETVNDQPQFYTQTSAQLRRIEQTEQHAATYAQAIEALGAIA